jgi:hypothetical protein
MPERPADVRPALDDLGRVDLHNLDVGIDAASCSAAASRQRASSARRGATTSRPARRRCPVRRENREATTHLTAELGRAKQWQPQQKSAKRHFTSVDIETAARISFRHVEIYLSVHG